MPLKLDAVPVPASFRKRHERKGGAELEMYSVARLDGFLRLTVGAEPTGKKGASVTHLSVSFAENCQPTAPPTRRPSDKELREVRAHFSYMGTFEEDNSKSDAGGLVRRRAGGDSDDNVSIRPAPVKRRHKLIADCREQAG